MHISFLNLVRFYCCTDYNCDDNDYFYNVDTKWIKALTSFSTSPWPYAGLGAGSTVFWVDPGKELTYLSGFQNPRNVKSNCLGCGGNQLVNKYYQPQWLSMGILPFKIYSIFK
jgi:hypothetical protein